MSHYPNPFDFVPFPSAPILRTEQQFDALGEKLSGYLELEIKALTPVHVVGRVEAGAAEHKSFFFQQDDQPCIPASSIRGCLRAFTEALTAGWVSQATPEYPKEYRGRHVGFKTFENYESSRRRTSPPAVDPAFKPGASSGELDVASYLFGTVVEGKQTAHGEQSRKGEDGISDVADHDGKQTAHGEQSRKSKVWVEDAYLPLEAIAFDKDVWAPDIGGRAFMGGAKPSASNWWYFEPAKVWKRSLYDRNGYPLLDKFGRKQEVAEFIGDHFLGRKFYYHQDPERCIQKYDPKKGQWLYPENESHQSTFHPVWLECMVPEKTTLLFRIYLDGVPQPLFQLLKNIIQPGEHIRHKLGYAKAYGYGSIEFILKSAKLRTVGLGIPEALERGDVSVVNWDMESLAKYGVADFIDLEALAWLARILGWPHKDLLFMYPQYMTLDPRTKKLKQPRPIEYGEYEHRIKSKMPVSNPMTVTSKDSCAIAEALWDLKRPIDFRLYQERAAGWHVIERRVP